jgi:hypothetical protein
MKINKLVLKKLIAANWNDRFEKVKIGSNYAYQGQGWNLWLSQRATNDWRKNK